MKSAGFIPPNERAALLAKPSEYIVDVMFFPKGTSLVSHPSCTPSSSSCSANDLPSVLPEMKIYRFFSCSSRAICTAISFVGAAPTTAANPGAVPSTNSIPLSRNITSAAAPSHMPSTGFGPIRYLHASITSSAKRVAMPASRAQPRYGRKIFSSGTGGSNALACPSASSQSPSVFTSKAVAE